MLEDATGTEITVRQGALFPDVPVVEFASTRYQGSKAKLADWIWGQVAHLDFMTCLDAFGGTGVIGHRFKQGGKQVTYNDILRFNHLIGLALIENSGERLGRDDVDRLLQRHPKVQYPDFVRQNFRDVYYTDEENAWIDQTITNIRGLRNPYKLALGFFALCQACIIKRPYNLFHRKNLYMRLAKVQRSFGNKTTWDRAFAEWFRVFADQANRSVFDNGHANRALNLDAAEVSGNFDLVYIDTPYLSKAGVGVDYLSFYHFLEGLAIYDQWGKRIDRSRKHRPFQACKNQWADKNRVHSAFDRLFRRYRESILVVSYRSDGIPSESELVSLLRRYKRDVRVEHFGHYKYVLSTNSTSKEILFVAT